MIRKRKRKAAAGRTGGVAETRRDDKGIAWRKAEVEMAAIAIVAANNRTTARDIGRGTQFGKSLGWDDWYKLTLVKPVKKQLHVTLSHTMIKNDVKTVGNLVDYIWSLMEAI